MTKLTILGHEFDLPEKYEQGMVISENEAMTLNALRIDGIRRDFTKVVKKILGKTQENDDFLSERLQTDFFVYEGAYTFPPPRPSRPVINPAFREAQKIARAQITAALQQRGIKPSSLKPGFMESRVEALLEKSPEILAEAERRLAALKTVSEDILGEVT